MVVAVCSRPVFSESSRAYSPRQGGSSEELRPSGPTGRLRPLAPLTSIEFFGSTHPLGRLHPLHPQYR